MKSFVGYIVAFLVSITLVVAVATYTVKSDKANVSQKIESVGGKIIEVDYKLNIIGTPFIIASKGERVYQVTYSKDGVIKEGYVKFGLFEDWRLTE